MRYDFQWDNYTPETNDEDINHYGNNTTLNNEQSLYQAIRFNDLANFEKKKSPSFTYTKQ